MVAASKVPMLKPEWCNLAKTNITEGVITEMPNTIAEEKAQKRLEDAKKLMEAVEKRFCENAATRKTQKILLKWQYENFTAPSSKMLDQTFDRLYKLMNQLELLEEKLSQEDINQKLLRSLSPEWNTHAVVQGNKVDLDIMSMDYLYKNLKVYEPEVKGMSSSSSSTQNMTFLASLNNNTSSTNGAVNTAQVVNTAPGVSTTSTQVNDAYSTNIDNLSDVVICAFFASQPNSPQLVSEDLQQIHPYDMEELYLRWQMAMLTMRARSFLKNIGRKLAVNGNEAIGKLKKCVLMETSTSIALISYDDLGGYDLSDHAEEGPNYALMAFSSSIRPPYTRIFMPPTLDLSFTSLDEFVNEFVVENYKAMSSEEEPTIVRKYDDALRIKEWVSDNEEEDVSQPKI
nr:hypothetical protein [Tanacetum cinerariifolium]